MASKTEGIALLSMYNDEEEDDDDEEETVRAAAAADEVHGGENDNGAAPTPQEPVYEGTPPSPLRRPSPFPFDEDTGRQTLHSPFPQTPPTPPSTQPPTQSAVLFTLPSPPQPQPPTQSAVLFTLPSPPQPQPQPPATLSEPVDAPRARKGLLTIVDYEHDETAMSPEPEEGEIVIGGHDTVYSDNLDSNGNIEERTPPGNVHILTSSTELEPPQASDIHDQSKSETSTDMDLTGAEAEVAQVEEDPTVSLEMQKDDPLNKFLPPPVAMKCPDELQDRINKFLLYKKAGKSFNADLRNRKDYRNPDFLQHAVRYQEIDQIGTCFSKDVFDPHGYDKCDYYDEIEVDMKRELERKEHERKRNQKVEFMSGGAQPASIAPALKIAAQVPVTGVSAAAASGLPPVSTAVDILSSRHNKKTKWDKVDGDAKNPQHSGGHDNLSTVGAHAVHLSAANAGTGYTAFAQQKRREAEEKRSSDRKF